MYHIFISGKLSLNTSISSTVFGTKMIRKIALFKRTWAKSRLDLPRAMVPIFYETV